MPGSHSKAEMSRKLEPWGPETPVSHRMGVPASPRERALDRYHPWTWNAQGAGGSLPIMTQDVVGTQRSRGPGAGPGDALTCGPYGVEGAPRPH